MVAILCFPLIRVERNYRIGTDGRKGGVVQARSKVALQVVDTLWASLYDDGLMIDGSWS
jgi:hypothetical protein